MSTPPAEKNKPFTPDDESNGWLPVVHAADCAPCVCCGEPICPNCEVHYVDCDCPGPHQQDEFEYRETAAGELLARRLPEQDE